MTGLAPSMMAAGVGIAGLITDFVIRRLGASRACWASAIAMAVGAFGLASASNIASVFASLFSMGVTGGVLLGVTSSTLSQHHGNKQAVAIVEANIIAGVFSVAAPLFLVISEHAGFGWQLPLALPGFAVLVAYLSFRTETFPSGHTARLEHTGKRLTRHYWVYWMLLVTVVADENALNVWGPQYFESVVGVARSTAQLAPVAFYIAFLGSRVFGALLTRRYNETGLLYLSLASTLFGASRYALWPATIPAIFGYAIAGFGVANLWPLTLSLAIRAGKAGGLASTAAARTSSAPGLSTLIVPPALGVIADQFGLHIAQFAIVLMVLCGLVLLRHAQSSGVVIASA